jgi:hypothetical protein
MLTGVILTFVTPDVVMPSAMMPNVVASFFQRVTHPVRSRNGVAQFYFIFFHQKNENLCKPFITLFLK